MLAKLDIYDIYLMGTYGRSMYKASLASIILPGMPYTNFEK